MKFMYIPSSIVIPDLLHPADIFATKGEGIVGYASKNFTKTPYGGHTDRIHFGLIGLPKFDILGGFTDFTTGESICKGPALSTFFEHYMGSDIEIYRMPGISIKDGVAIFLEVSSIGRKDYGYYDYVLLTADAVRLMFHFKFPPYTAQQLKYSANDEYLCTEEVAYAYRKRKHQIEPRGYEKIWVIPTVYLQAVEEGRLEKWYHGDLTDLYQVYTGRNYMLKE